MLGITSICQHGQKSEKVAIFGSDTGSQAKI